MAFELKQSQSGPFVVLSPVGRLDTKTSPELEKKVVELLQGGTRRFVVDFGPTEYVSSAGLRVLLMLAKKLAGGEGSLVLCGMNPGVREVFDVAGFSSVFTIATTVGEAVASAPAPTRMEELAQRAAARLAQKPKGGRRSIDAETAGLAERAARALGVKTKK